MSAGVESAFHWRTDGLRCGEPQGEPASTPTSFACLATAQRRTADVAAVRIGNPAKPKREERKRTRYENRNRNPAKAL